MGLADFLAQAGDRTAIGQVAQAFGGRTGSQQRMDDFTNQVQAITQEIHGNTDETKVRDLGSKLLTAAAKAGIPLQHAEKLMDMAIGPALQGIRQEGLNNLAAQYRGQPAVEAQSRPTPDTEGPLTPQGNFIDPKAATPDKPLDLNFMMKYAQLTGANPEVANKMLQTPGLLTSQLLSQKKTQGEIDKESQAQQQRRNLPNTPLGPGQPSLQDIGVLDPTGIAQTLPQREKPEDPLLEERRNLLNAQATRDSALAAKALQGPGGAGGAGSETTTDRNVTPAIQADAEKKIATAARDRGTTKPEQIRQIAADFGYDMTGNPTLEDSALPFGLGSPSLKGEFSLTPKATTKTTTKGQGGYNKGASGSGSGGQAPGRPVAQTAPKRLKFDAKGNLIQ